MYMGNIMANIFYRVINKIKSTNIKRSLHRLKNVSIGDDLHVNAGMKFYLHKEAKLCIGNNVTFYSQNDDYHMNMFAGVKLIADRPGALIKIGDNTRINGSCIHAWKSVIIGNNCLVAANVNIMDSNGHPVSMNNPSERIMIHDQAEPIVIEDNVWIGCNSIILKGVTIGEGSIVSAGSVVIDDVPARSIVRGNPAIVVKMNIE